MATMKKKMTPKQFEKSRYDKDTKSAPEGSKKDMARDKAQLKKVNKGRK